jgi:hypothetical protein
MRERDNGNDEEADYDYRPKRRKSSNKTLFIILGVVGGVVLLVVLGCAGLIYWGVNKFSQFPNLTTEADRFLDDLKTAQVDAAYARTSRNFKRAQAPAQFQAFLKQFPAFTNQTSRRYTGFNIFSGVGGARGTIHATAIGPGNSVSFTLILVEEDGQWKVDQLTIQ